MTQLMAALAVLAMTATLASCQVRESGELTIERSGIAFDGTIYPHRYDTHSDRQNGHHFIVWKGGRASGKALIEGDVPDPKLLEALIQLGAKAGDNLTEATWTSRDDASSKEPDEHVEGTPVAVTVEWDGTEHPIEKLFADASAKDFEIRVGGHAALIPIWKSGCITCLFSCPGGRTSNAKYTIRDQAKDRKRFVADEAHLPKDGTKVRVHIRLLEPKREQ